MLLHKGEKPYSCEECESEFSVHITLNAHIQRHKEEKPFYCEVCGSAFLQSSNLKTH